MSVHIEFAWRLCSLMRDMQQVCRGAGVEGVGVWGYGMQPYSINRGCGDGPICHPLLIQMGLYVVGF